MDDEVMKTYVKAFIAGQAMEKEVQSWDKEAAVKHFIPLRDTLLAKGGEVERFTRDLLANVEVHVGDYTIDRTDKETVDQLAWLTATLRHMRTDCNLTTEELQALGVQ